MGARALLQVIYISRLQEMHELAERNELADEGPDESKELVTSKTSSHIHTARRETRCERVERSLENKRPIKC